MSQTTISQIALQAKMDKLVSQRNNAENDLVNLTGDYAELTSQFNELKQKYDALLALTESNTEEVSEDKVK
jgi:predicted  nucleic acid-binding Zn-ribbon protein